MRIILFFLLFGCHILSAHQGQDTIVVKNLISEAYVYDNSLETYRPVIDLGELNEKSLHVNLNSDQHGNYLLGLKSQSDISVFVNNKMVASLTTGQYLYYQTDSLFNIYGEEFKFTIYGEEISTRSFSFQLLATDLPETQFLEEEEVILVSQRSRDKAYNNFIIIGLIILAIYLATINNFYPKITADFFKLSRAISVREIDENLLKSRPFTRINLIFYLFFSLLTSYSLIFLFHSGNIGFTNVLQSTGSFLWFWFRVSGIILLWLLGKYLLIKYFTGLFNIKSFMPSHYFNYIRLGLLIFVFSVVLLVISYFAIGTTAPSYYQVLFNILLAAVVIRSLIVMLKLMNSASYKFLHLFSYLCGTEFIPLGIIFFLGLNQHF